MDEVGCAVTLVVIRTAAITPLHIDAVTAVATVLLVVLALC